MLAYRLHDVSFLWSEMLVTHKNIGATGATGSFPFPLASIASYSLHVTFYENYDMAQTNRRVKQEETLQEKCSVLLKIVERFREVDAEMQAQSIAVLLKVAKHDLPIKMADIAEELGLSQSSVSRNVAYLGDWNRRKVQGHKLLEAYEDPAERRRKLVRLTAKGKRFVNSFTDLI